MHKLRKLRDYLSETYDLWGFQGIILCSLINLRLFIRRIRAVGKEYISSFMETVKAVYGEGKLIGLFWWFSPVKPLNLPNGKRQMIFAIPVFKERKLCMLILSRIKD